MCNTRRLEDIVIVMEDCLIKLDKKGYLTK